MEVKTLILPSRTRAWSSSPAARTTRRAVRRRSTFHYSGGREYVVRNIVYFHWDTECALSRLWSRHAASGHATAAWTRTAMNHFLSRKSPQSVSCLSAQSTTLRCQFRLPSHRKTWLFCRSYAFGCLSLAFTDRLRAICHLSHALVWEYNIPQRLVVARHVACGVGLKFRSRNRSRPALFNSGLRGDFTRCCQDAQANGSRVATQVGMLTRTASIPNRWATVYGGGKG